MRSKALSGESVPKVPYRPRYGLKTQPRPLEWSSQLQPPVARRGPSFLLYVGDSESEAPEAPEPRSTDTAQPQEQVGWGSTPRWITATFYDDIDRGME